MEWSQMYTTHCTKLNQEEEQRFIAATDKKYKKRHGVVVKALHEAIMEWIAKVEAE